MFKKIGLFVLKKFLNKRRYLFDENIKGSFSQFGEDMVLQYIFLDKNPGLYVDVGAFHPTLYSNTHLLYLKGWRGVNIEPMPNSMQLFRKIRKKDINLEIGISNKKKKLKYYVYSQPAVNSFNKNAVGNNKQYELIDVIKIRSLPLREVLRKKVKNLSIDLLNVDTEGSDYDVLKSNDWIHYRPYCIVVEDLDFDISNPKKSKVYNFLISKNYRLFSILVVSLIFLRKDDF